jgi:transposase
MCGREAQVEISEDENMANNLSYEKEEEVKSLLKTDSIREIIKKTGVSKNSVTRIRNENFTEKERVEMKKRANVKGRNKRELKKEGGDKEMEEILTKDCRKCGPKPIAEFTKSKGASDGFDPLCRKCKSDYRLERIGEKTKGNMGDGRFKKIKKSRDYKAEYKRRASKAPLKIPSSEIANLPDNNDLPKKLLGILHKKVKEIGALIETFGLLQKEGIIRKDAEFPSLASLMDVYGIGS